MEPQSASPPVSSAPRFPPGLGELLRRAQGNDRAAFRGIVAACQARVFSIALRLTGSSLPQDATRTATVNALAASGWHAEQTSAGARVFTSASVPDAQAACREGRRLTFILGRMEGATYVLITLLC